MRLASKLSRIVKIFKHKLSKAKSICCTVKTIRVQTLLKKNVLGNTNIEAPLYTWGCMQNHEQINSTKAYG